jgi:hypothetical protein
VSGRLLSPPLAAFFTPVAGSACARMHHMTLDSVADFHVREGHEQKGAGLFASRPFCQGEEIYRFDYWSQKLMPMHFTNHSCDPNATFNAAGMLVAIRNIEPGEELTFDYLLHPTPASPWDFECSCGAESCIGWVKVVKNY